MRRYRASVPRVGLVATTVRGLEWVAAEEVDALPGSDDVGLAARQVTFTLPADRVGDAVTLRTVDDVAVRIGIVRGVNQERTAPVRLARAAGRLDLGAARRVVEAFRSPLTATDVQPVLDVVASLDGDRRFNRYDIEEAVGAEAGVMLGARYVSRRHEPPPPSQLSLRVAISGDRADLSLRLAERPLHRRAWKRSTASGTLHPPAAAALIRLTGSPRMLFDPCCGDGTVVIEAACCGVPATGSDVDVSRLQNAARNLAAAPATRAPTFVRADAARLPFPALSAGPVAVATNPPWNRSVDAVGGLVASLDPLWEEAARLAGDDAVMAVIVEESIGPTPVGWHDIVRQRARLAGRVVEVAVLHRGGGGLLPRRLGAWRQRAIAEGVTTEVGF